MLCLFELRFTNLSLSSRRTIYGPDDAASSYSAALGAGRAVTAALEYRGGLVVRRRRWTGQTSLSAGKADSDYDITYNGSDPLIHPAAQSLWPRESGDIGSGGADYGSVLNGHCRGSDYEHYLPLLTLLNRTGSDLIQGTTVW